MSPTSYRTAPLRDILVPEAGVEPVRVLPHGILSPGRLPIPPHQQILLFSTNKIIPYPKENVNIFPQKNLVLAIILYFEYKYQNKNI